MSRRSVTTVTFRIRMRLPPGVSVQRAKDFLKGAIAVGKQDTPNGDPIKSLDALEIIITVAERSTAYLSTK